MSLIELLGIFLFYTVVTFGNALVMFPILDQELVHNRNVITSEQLLYAFAVARVTPGLFNLYVTSIGYMLYGIVGATLSTIIITLPTFTILPLHGAYNKIKKNVFISNFVIAMTATSIGLIISSVIEMGKITLTGISPWIVFAVTLLLSRVVKKNTFLCFVLASFFGIVLKMILDYTSG